MHTDLEAGLRAAIAALWEALYERAAAGDRAALVRELFVLVLARSCFDQPDVAQRPHLPDAVAEHATRAFALVARVDEETGTRCPALSVARVVLGELIELTRLYVV